MPSNIKSNLIKCFETFKKSNYVVIVTHTNPDGDAIGSQLAMYHYACKTGKKAVMITESQTPENLKFLPGTEEIINSEKTDTFHNFLMADCIVILDLNDSRRLKSLEQKVKNSNAKKILIDHHLDPQAFADAYYIDSEATSTGELLYDFISLDKSFIMDRETAECLYVAIMTDTGSFRFPRTDSKTHSAIGKLIDSGADPVMMYDEVFNQNSIQAIHLLGSAIKSMQLLRNGMACIMTIDKDMITGNNAKDEDVDNFVNWTLTIKGVQLGIMIAEFTYKEEVRMSFRSKGKVSARQVAEHFGGGGHFHAAGARMFNSTIEDTREAVIRAVERFI